MACECKTPLLTAASFFLSVGIFTGAVILFYALRIALFKLLGPKTSYAWKFNTLIYDMKEVIRCGRSYRRPLRSSLPQWLYDEGTYYILFEAY
jgi:hypothetical protein